MEVALSITSLHVQLKAGLLFTERLHELVLARFTDATWSDGAPTNRVQLVEINPLFSKSSITVSSVPKGSYKSIVRRF